MKVIGIDPGSQILGWGVVEGDYSSYCLVDYGILKLNKNEKFSKRLLKIFDEVTNLIEKFNPSVLSVEQCFYAVNVQVALKLGQVRGVVMIAAEKSGLEVVEYQPRFVKQTIVGYGNAKKNQVQEMVRTLLRLNKSPQPYDASDALAIAICYFHNARIYDIKLKS